MLLKKTLLFLSILLCSSSVYCIIDSVIFSGIGMAFGYGAYCSLQKTKKKLKKIPNKNANEFSLKEIKSCNLEQLSKKTQSSYAKYKKTILPAISTCALTLVSIHFILKALY